MAVSATGTPGSIAAYCIAGGTWPGDSQGVEMVWADGILILGLSVSMEFRSELQ